MIHAVLAAALSVAGALPCAPAQADEQALVFTHVSVLSMDADEVLIDHGVVVRGDRIASIGPMDGEDALEIPAGATVVDGTGKWLMPGLADMHVHSWREHELPVFLAYGITTVRNMFGAPLHLGWRDEVARGERVGPTIYTAGPIVDGNPPVWPGSSVATTMEDAVDVVLAQHEAGYDFIKVYARLPMDAYAAIVGTADELGMPVMGHVPAAVGLSEVLLAGQVTIEHLDGYDIALAPAGVVPSFGVFPKVDPADLERVAQATAEAGTWNCPTLVVYDKMVGPQGIEAELAKPGMRYVTDASIAGWRASANGRGGDAYADMVQGSSATRDNIVAALHAAGARIVLGTDYGNPLLAPGYSVHEELANFVGAGLTPFEALRTGTVEAAACMGDEDEFGRVAVGLRADLLLLSNNPLEHLDGATRPDGVMARGRWYSRDTLDAMLDDVAAELGRADGED